MENVSASSGSVIYLEALTGKAAALSFGQICKECQIVPTFMTSLVLWSCFSKLENIKIRKPSSFFNVINGIKLTLLFA